MDAIEATGIEELFYGGAAGGGKTDFLLGDFLQDVPTYEGAWRGALFRRTMGEMDDIIARSLELYPSTGAFYNDGKYIWRWPNGASLRFRYLERDVHRLRYQGAAFCVATGTPIRMADGRFKPIESVEIGDMVATLEGPSRVTDRVRPYLAPCVSAQVRFCGAVVGEQVHPIWHPVFSGAGWRAFSTDDRSGDRASSASRRDDERPAALSFPVTLHAPTVRLRLRQQQFSRRKPSVCRSPGISARLLSTSKEVMRRFEEGLQQQTERWRQFLGRVVRPGSNDLACGLNCSQIAAGLRQYYLSAFGPCGGRALSLSGIDRSSFQQQGGAEPRHHAELTDVLGTIPKHIHKGQPSWVHPYTGEERHLAEEVLTGSVNLTPCGDRLVCDITVEGANHYISECGLVNKNTWIGWDELTQWATDVAYRYLRGRLRSAHNVPTKRIRSAANPGGAGHHWVKAYFVTPAPGGNEVLYDPETKHHRVFIPSKLKDNRILLLSDPNYVGRLRGLGSATLVKAMLDGDWDIVEGAFFDCWSGEQHVIKPFVVPKTWARFRSMDWGSASPFSVGWWAVVQDDYRLASGKILPRGALVRYREWYGTRDPAVAGKGLKLFSAAVGKGIVEREKDDPRLVGAVLDPSAFAADGGPPISEDIQKALIKAQMMPFRPADNTRVSERGSKDKRGPMAGWDQMRMRMVGTANINDDGTIDWSTGRPMVYCFDTCIASIRTIPVLQHDPAKPEDLDTKSEDHAADDWRYGLNSRPWVRSVEEKDEPKDAYRSPDDDEGSSAENFNKAM